MPRLFRKWKKEEIERVLSAIKNEAYNLGANKVAIVDPRRVVVDERVVYKCMWGCPHYNASLMCPPYTPKPDDTRKLLNQYRYALLVRKEGKSEEFAGQSAIENNQWVKYGEELRRTMLNLESSAFYRGFYLALALVAGCCRICSQDGTCKGLGQGRCLHAYESRPSMEALGIDVMATLDYLRWKIQVVGRETEPEKISEVGYVGLLLVC